MPVITLLPSGTTAPCRDGDSLFNVARAAGVVVATACVGKGNCGLCRVKIVQGEAFLSPLNEVEARHMGNVYFITRERLACQARVQGGDVTIQVPPVERRRG